MPDPFIVRYTSIAGSLWRYTILPALFFGLTWASLAYPPFNDLLVKEDRGGPVVYALVFGIIGLIASFEIIISIIKIFIGRPALKIDQQGLRGWHMWLPRRIDWSEYLTHHRSKGDLILSRKPRLDLETHFGKIWSKVFGGSNYHIAVPLEGVDKTEAEILAAVSEFRSQ